MNKLRAILFALIMLSLGACGTFNKTKGTQPSSYSEDLSSLREKYERPEVAKPTEADAKSPFVNPVRHSENELRIIMDSLASRNKQRGFVEGHSVQVYSGASRNQATEIRTKIMEIFGDLNPEIRYEQPNYKVKVGFFAERIEAYPTYSKLKKEFPGALLVPERLNVRQ
jgi:hypothetical protein